MVAAMHTDEPKWYVYAYLDPTTGEPFYIGKGHGNRSRTHLLPYLLKKRKLFYNKLRKMIRNGDAPVIVHILERLTNAEALCFETFFILAIGRRCDRSNRGPLCNLTDGGEGIPGKRHSEATRKRLSQASREACARRTPEQLAKQRAATSRANKGRKLSAAVRANQSAAQRARYAKNPMSAEHIEKRRRANIGRRASEETKQKMRESQRARYRNSPRSKETIQRQRGAQLARFAIKSYPPAPLNPRSIPLESFRL